MRRAALIVNPVAGKNSQKKIKDFIKGLEKHNFDILTFPTQYSGHATLLAKDIEKRDDIEFIIVAGGDGTINELINGFISFNKPVAVVPLGSANVLACELGIYNICDSLNAILMNNLVDCYLGTINNDRKSRKFILMAGVGFDGYVVRNVKYKGRAAIKKFLFIFEGIKELLKKDEGMIDLFINGKKISCSNAIVCKASKYGGNFIIASSGILQEPVFQVLAFGSPNKILLVKFLFSTLLRLSYPKGIKAFSASEVEIRGKKPVQIDGEFFGYTPCEISIYPETIKIFSSPS